MDRYEFTSKSTTFRNHDDFYKDIVQFVPEVTWCGLSLKDEDFEANFCETSGVGPGIHHPTQKPGKETSKLYLIFRDDEYKKPPEGYNTVAFRSKSNTYYGQLSMMRLVKDSFNCEWVLCKKKRRDQGVKTFKSFQEIGKQSRIDQIMPRVKDLLQSDKDTLILGFWEFRHDILHAMICDYYGLPFYTGTTGVFPKFLTKKKKLTPDIFACDEKEKIACIGDVQCSRNTTLSVLNKKRRYEPWTKELVRLGYEINEVYVCVDENLGNLSQCLLNISLSSVNTHYEFFEKWKIVGIFRDRIEEIHGKDVFTVSKKVFEKKEEQRIFPDEFPEPKILHDIETEDETDLQEYKEWIKMALEEGYMKDNKLNTSDFDTALQHIREENERFDKTIKPSFHCPAMEFESGDEIEQLLTINFLENASVSGDELVSAFRDALRSVMKNKQQKEIYMTGKMVLDEELESKMRSMYHRERSERIKSQEKIKSRSYRDFLIAQGVLQEYDRTKPFAQKKKCVRVNNMSIEAREDWDKSGAGRKKKNNKREYKQIRTTNLESSTLEMESLISYLGMVEDRGEPPVMEAFEGYGVDDPNINIFKENTLEKSKEILRTLCKTRWFHFSRYSSLFYEQILHLSNYSIPEKSVHFFNCGLKNMLCVLTGGYRGMHQKNGKSFKYYVITSNPQLYTGGLFGKVEAIKIGDKYLCQTRWLRLPGHRVEFMKDAHISCLSSTMATMNRMANINPVDVDGTYGMRIIFSFIQSTQFIEMAADSRYAITSSLATHTNFCDLIIEKFSPPYRNQGCAWLALKLITSLKEFRNNILNNKSSVLFNRPEFDVLSRRLPRSTGGILDVKAIWSDRRLRTMQDLMDEIFIYCHTPKEPSQTFHENVRAIKTIKKFSEEYERLSKNNKNGILEDYEEFKDLILNRNVGFCKTILEEAVRVYLKGRNVDIESAVKEMMTEPLSLLTSTKAVIEDDRKEFKPIAKGLMEAIKWRKRAGKEDFMEIAKAKMAIKVEKHSRPRKKVHDVMLHMSKKYETVYEAAKEFHNSGKKVIADICIKAQYGSKREFYVMNFGAKLMARVVETVSKKISEQSPTEMISVSGDRKYFHIQSVLSQCTEHAIKNETMLYYVNGDCTKWSASETMEALAVVINGLTKDLNKNLRNFLVSIIGKWREKEIHVPQELVTSSLKLKDQILRPKQNFLQGVYNYLSSLKSDIANNYTLELWKEMFPRKKIMCKYLVHSDDYCLVVCCENREDFELFRSLHKTIFRCCGIKDSSKKTNCQYVFLEFISLFGFNGSTCYPTIKKTKECTTTLPSEGFPGDSDFVCSRTSECVRLGVPLDSCYMFLRLHMYSLRKSYSLSWANENKFKEPVEFFGQSDMLPIFYLLCKGDPNNVRLYLNGYRDDLKRVLHLSKRNPEIEGIWSGRFRPDFLYNRYSDIVKKIRSYVESETGIGSKEAIAFLEENPSYNFTKPTNPRDLHIWMASKYWSNSFIKAYNRDTRSIRTLRLSMFSSGKCMTLMTPEELRDFYNTQLPTRESMKTEEWNKNTFTMKEIYIKYKEMPKDEDTILLLRYVLNGDSTPMTIYDMFSTMSIREGNRSKKYIGNTVACYVSPRPKWIPTSGQNDLLLQYIDNPEIAIRNSLPGTDWESVKKDKDMLFQTYGFLEDCMNNNKREAISLISKMLSNNKLVRTVCMSTSKERRDILSFIKGHMEVHCYATKTLKIDAAMSMRIKDPFIGTEHVVIGRTPTLNDIRSVITGMVLSHCFMTVRTKIDEETQKDILKRCRDVEGRNCCGRIIDMDRDDPLEKTLTRVEKQYLAYLKLFLMNDSRYAMQLLSEDNFFEYGWDSSQEKTLKDISGKEIKRGNVTIYIRYRGTCASFTKYWKEGNVKMFCEGSSSHKAIMIYKIGKMLLNDYKNKPVDFILKEELSKSEEITFKKAKDRKSMKLLCTHDYRCVDNKEEVEALPIYLLSEVRWKGHWKRINLDMDPKFFCKNLSLYTGKLKMFTINMSHLYSDGSVIHDRIVYEGYDITNIMNSRKMLELFKRDSYPGELSDVERLEETKILITEGRRDIKELHEMGEEEKEEDGNVEKEDWTFATMDLKKEGVGLMDDLFDMSKISVVGYEDDEDSDEFDLMYPASETIHQGFDCFAQEIYTNTLPRQLQKRSNMKDIQYEIIYSKNSKQKKFHRPLQVLSWSIATRKTNDINKINKYNVLSERAVMMDTFDYVNGHIVVSRNNFVRLFKVKNVQPTQANLEIVIEKGYDIISPKEKNSIVSSVKEIKNVFETEDIMSVKVLIQTDQIDSNLLREITRCKYWPQDVVPSHYDSLDEL